MIVFFCIFLGCSNSYLCWFFAHGIPESTRIYLPRRVLSVTNCGSFGSDDYCELGSRFKAAHIRVMVWWIAHKVQQLTENSDSWLKKLLMILGLALSQWVPWPPTFHSNRDLPSLSGQPCPPASQPLLPFLGQSSGFDGWCWFDLEPRWSQCLLIKVTIFHLKILGGHVLSLPLSIQAIFEDSILGILMFVANHVRHQYIVYSLLQVMPRVAQTILPGMFIYAPNIFGQ